MDENSPLLNSSNDIIDLIVQKIACETTKMRLGLVCRRLSIRVGQRSAWKLDHDLHIVRTTADQISINGREFMFGNCSNAIEKLLKVITLKCLSFNVTIPLQPQLVTYIARLFSINKQFIKVRQYTKIGAFDDSLFVSVMVGCGLIQLKELTYGEMCGESFVPYLFSPSYSILFDSVNLVRLCLAVTTFSHDDWQCLITALVNCEQLVHISLQIGEGEILAGDAFAFFAMCDVFLPRLKEFIFWVPIEGNLPMLEFINHIGDNLKESLTTLGLFLDGEIQDHRNSLPQICPSFPHLKSLLLYSLNAFPSEAVMDVLHSVFVTYSNGAVNPYEFDISIDCSEEERLVRKLPHKRWEEDDDFIQLSVINEIWKCKQNNVEISLSFLNHFEDEEFDDEDMEIENEHVENEDEI